MSNGVSRKKYFWDLLTFKCFLALLSRDFFLVKLPMCFVYYSYRVAVCQNKRTLCTVLKALLGQPSEPKASWLPEFPFDVKKKHSNVKSQISSMINRIFTAISKKLQTSLSSNYIQSWNSLENSATSKDQQFLLQCISFCSFFLLSCWEGVITNCSEIQQSLALGFIRFYVIYEFGLGLNLAGFLLYILVRSIEI